MKIKEKSASMTVEASLILPIFLFAMILVGYLGQMIRCQNEVQAVLTRVAREASAEYGATESKILESRAYYTAKINLYLSDPIGKISLLESRLFEENDEIDLVAVYRMSTPFSIIGTGNCHFRQRVHMRAFTGVERREKEVMEDDIVYITETGNVYHRTRECHYLDLSISEVLYSDLENLRNESGAKYKSCSRCVKGEILEENDTVRITSYGDCFHTSASCSGLKRNIRGIRLCEVGKRAPCSKCGKE